jgi:hypothetical protein
MLIRSLSDWIPPLLAVAVLASSGWRAECGPDDTVGSVNGLDAEVWKAAGDFLRKDARLSMRVSMELERPTIRQILTRLDVATRVTLRPDPLELADNTSLGMLKVKNAPAWQVMRQVLSARGVEGRWEKEGEGYRLILRQSQNAPSKTGNSTAILVWIFGVLSSVLLVLYVAVWVRRRRSVPL